MYPTNSSNNYYATLAEPANPDDDKPNNTSSDTSNHQPIPILHNTTVDKQPKEPKKTTLTKTVRWAAQLAENQDKPRNIPILAKQCNIIRDRHRTRLDATTKLRTTQRTQAIIDSGATGHYGSSEGGWIQMATPLDKVVGLADGTPVAASVIAKLPYPNLLQEARAGDIIPGLKNDLLSVKRLADAKLTTILHEHGAEVYPTEALTITATTEPVLRGCRDKTGLWRVSPAPQVAKAVTWHENTKPGDIAHPNTANAVFDLPSISQTIKWHHASLGFPTKDTLIKAINNGHFNEWPLLTQHNISKHFPESEETIMGHTNQQRQGVRSTKPKLLPQTNAAPETGITHTEPTQAILTTVYQLTHTIYSDQTGRLPCRSRTGNQYIMVILHEDSNYAFEEPMKNKSDKEMQRAYRAIITRIKNAKLTIKSTSSITSARLL